MYRTLLYSSIFAYPTDKKSLKGKLRILYKCRLMAIVFKNGESMKINNNCIIVFF